jgi:methyl-accepting chemotaxis protein PixJ
MKNNNFELINTQVSIQKLLEQQQLLGKIAQKIGQSLNLSEILNTAVTEVRQFLQADRVVIYQFHLDWCGEVVAEAVEEPWIPILGSTITDPCIEKNWVEIYKRGQVKTITNIHNADINPCHIELLKQYQVQANMVMPILMPEQLWGLLIAHQCSSPRDWDLIEVQVLTQLAVQLAIAIQQAQQYQELQQQYLQSQLIADITSKIHQSLQLDVILQTTVTEVQKILQADRVVIYRILANGTGKIISEAVLPGYPAILGLPLSEDMFPQEYQEHYRQGSVHPIALARPPAEACPYSPTGMKTAQRHVQPFGHENSVAGRSPVQTAERLAEKGCRAIADIHDSALGLPDSVVQFLDQWGVKSKLIVSILENLHSQSPSENKLWGFLVAHHCAAPRHWTEFEVNLMQQLANQVGIAITQAQLTQELESLVQQRTAELQQSLQKKAESENNFRILAEKERLLSTLTRRIHRSLNLEKILSLTVAEIRQILRIDRVIFYQFNQDYSGTVVAESVDINCKPMLGRQIFDDRFAEEYIQSYVNGRIYAVEDIFNSNLTQCHIDLLVEFDIKSVLVIPIVYGKTLWGLLSLHHCRVPRKWQSSEIEFLQKLARQVTIAIQQSLLVEQLEAELVARRQAETELRRSAISRTLVGEILRDLQNLGNLSQAAMFKAGQELAARISAETLEDFLETFAIMGMGSLTLEQVTAKCWKFRGDKLVEVKTGSDSPTCDYARGFLCGAVVQKMGGQVKVAAVEMTCQSMADECCQFVVQVVE